MATVTNKSGVLFYPSQKAKVSREDYSLVAFLPFIKTIYNHISRMPSKTQHQDGRHPAKENLVSSGPSRLT
jgi:hypothetical protein